MRNKTLVIVLLSIALFFMSIAYYGTDLKVEAQQTTIELRDAQLQISTQAIQDLNYQIDSLRYVLDNTLCVTATVYYPTGDEMRSGKLIPDNYRRKTHKPNYIAISQDLWSRNGGPYSFGDSVRVEGTPIDGVYVIEDTMNKRHKNRVDILVSEKSGINSQWKYVKVCKV